MEKAAITTFSGLGEFGESTWAEVLTAVDRTYADLVSYQERLEQKNVELEELRRFLASVLSSVSDVMLVIDRDGMVVDVNEALLERSGLTRDTVIGAPAVSAIAAEDRPAFLAAVATVSASRKPQTIEAKFAARDGPTPIEFNLNPRLDDRGRSAGTVLIGRPLGELRTAYQRLDESHRELKETQGQLLRNEKLASLGRLLAGVAHELNNPISFVYANAHALDRYARKFETYFDRVQQGASRDELVQLRKDLNLDRELKNLRIAVLGAKDGAERVRDIVEDLRRLSADGSGEFAPFDLAETARVAASWVLRGAKSAPRVRFEGTAPLTAFGRSGHLQQVVMNLVQNAVDALRGESSGEIVVRNDAEGDFAHLDVIDNGPGVPEADAVRIFDPFYTTKPVGQGTGLGLSISHKIAQEHGGDLRLMPSQAGGAWFRLTLPRKGRP